MSQGIVSRGPATVRVTRCVHCGAKHVVEINRAGKLKCHCGGSFRLKR